MRLIVANCTKQNHDFLYIVPETAKQRRQMIPSGGQAYIHQDDTLEVLMGIVKQHEPYGLIDVKDINRRREFIGMCFSFDKPIDLDAIMVADGHNTNVLNDGAIETRKELAAAVNSQILESGAGLQSLEMEVIEDPKGASDTSPRLAAGVEIAGPGRRTRRQREMA